MFKRTDLSLYIDYVIIFNVPLITETFLKVYTRTVLSVHSVHDPFIQH